MTAILTKLFIYLFQVSLGLTLFIVFYRLFLARLTFFTANRYYLVSTALLSLLIPLNPFAFPPIADSLSNPILNQIPEMKVWVVGEALPVSSVEQSSFSFWLIVSFGLVLIYGLVTSYHLYKLSAAIFSIIHLIRFYPHYRYGNSWVVCIEEQVSASSFFNYIFLSPKEHNNQLLETILTHESMHCRQGHSFDRIFIELLRAFFWFHPLIKWWKNDLLENHEFLADTCTVAKTDPTSYATLLVELASQQKDISSLIKFSYGQLKSRIIMLHQPRSQSFFLIRFLLTLPLAAGLLLLYSCDKAKDMVAPTKDAPATHLMKASSLIGNWTSTNMMIINEEGKQQHRGLSANDAAICFNYLSLLADGTFHMQDTKTGKSYNGNWRSDQFGVSLNLTYYDALSKENSSNQAMFLQNGTPYRGLLPSIIRLSVTGLQTDQMEAWQSYPADEKYTAASIYYQYSKE